MTRIISLLLIISFMLISSITLTSCTPDDEDDANDSSADVDCDNKSDDEVEIHIPHLGEHGDRRTVKFSEIVYTRPDVPALTEEINAITLEIQNESSSFDEIVDRVEIADKEYEHTQTMYTYADVMTSRDNTDAYWQDEHSAISLAMPTLSKAIEDMLVAAATSEDALLYEERCFGEGLIEKYKDGGIFTDELVHLLALEKELENSYSAMSTANVTITYKAVTDTFDGIIDFYRRTYGESSESYANALSGCQKLYEKEKSRLTAEYYVDLVKVRRDIADELGIESYTEFAYGEIGHDYSPNEALEYFDGVALEIVPVYAALQYYVFRPYFNVNDEPPVTTGRLVNDLYELYSGISPELAEIYSYMLNYSLYDINPLGESRFKGSFTTYLNEYDAPYLFLSTSGGYTDVLSMAHEFGHFADSFINFDSQTSIDLAEVSSTALEMLTYASIKDSIDSDVAKHLHYTVVSDALSVLVYQSFYALFEHYVYEIEESEISEESVTAAMMSAAEKMGLNTTALKPDPEGGIYSSLDFVLIPHTVERPFYVESYCTSMTAALEIYFLESNRAGDGVNVYMDLIHRDSKLSFTEHLKEVGLSSPFADGAVARVADALYFDILGSYKQDNGKIKDVQIKRRAA